MPDIDIRLEELEQARQDYKSAYKRYLDLQTKQVAIANDMSAALNRITTLRTKLADPAHLQAEAKQELERQRKEEAANGN